MRKQIQLTLTVTVVEKKQNLSFLPGSSTCLFFSFTSSSSSLCCRFFSGRKTYKTSFFKFVFCLFLCSLFAATASKWVSEIDTIWKFQRYQLVIDFSNRLAVPAPFSLFYYIYVISQYLFQSASSLCKRNVNNWQVRHGELLPNWCAITTLPFLQRNKKRVLPEKIAGII